MDTESELLLYTVILGAGAGLFQLGFRRTPGFRVYFVELALLLAVSAGAFLLRPEWRRVVAWSAFVGFLVAAILPSLLLRLARDAAKRRRYRTARAAATAGATILGWPDPLAREASLYAVMADADRGDDGAVRARLERLARGAGVPVELGGDVFVRVLPEVARRDWVAVLSELDRTSVRVPTILAIEARAAAETGRIDRALRACGDIASCGPSAAPALHAARRAVLAASGRVPFFLEAAARGLPVVAGPPGTAEAALARAHEAAGDADTALARYEEVSRTAKGGPLIDAAAGALRCREGRIARTTAGPEHAEALLALEAACRTEAREASERRLLQRAPFTVGVTAATVLVSALVLVFMGTDSHAFAAAGALSEPLIVTEHQVWRLLSTVLLHGGWLHLGMNVAAILFIGVPYEAQVGSSRTAIVYLGSGLLASCGSAANHTPLGVGASGAAMGLIGALGVLVVRRPALYPEAERKRWISALVAGTGATLALGLLKHQVIDNVAHVAGLLAGIALGALLLPGRDRAVASAFVRVTAATLCGLFAACAAIAALQIPSWYGTRVVVGAGATVELPRWMRVFSTPDHGIVASRRPLPAVVQFGADGVVPDEGFLIAHEGGDLQRLFGGGPRRDVVDVPSGDLVTESREYGDPDGEGLRLTLLRRGSAFALVAVEIGPDEGGEADRIVGRIAATLAPVE